MQAPWGSRVDSSPLVPGSRPGVPGLVPAPWGTELDLAVSGGRAWAFLGMVLAVESGLVPDTAGCRVQRTLVSACHPTVGGVRPRAPAEGPRCPRADAACSGCGQGLGGPGAGAGTQGVRLGPGPLRMGRILGAAGSPGVLTQLA